MGKDLKGREIGRGLSQRKDKKYSARYVSKSGKRIEKYFNTLPEARNWLADAKYEDSHNNTEITSTVTVDTWFNYWYDNLIVDLSPNTRRNYKERYTINIKPSIGKMCISDVKPMHCKLILNKMIDTYAGSTIKQTFIAMGTMFRAAVMNDVISKHPMDGVRYTKPVKAASDHRVLTVDEQKIFLKVAKSSHNYYQYAFILETGLRTGELIGLTWDAIDWDNHTLTVNKTLEFRHKQKFWRAGPPKTQTSYRTIPLTAQAYNILLELKEKRKTQKLSEELSQVLTFTDRKTGQTSSLVMSDLVFINFRTGMPAKNSSYDTHLYKLCETAGIPPFSMHTLRHTYATRAIESGMQPKILQKLLGHASITTTMDTYVHVTDDSMTKAIQQFEAANTAVTKTQ
ncbi:MAG: tyrosine-type recombinase/integrase [Ruminococcus sp.]|nr:tyrosine-type recombinase/integrase [Ruminococcus sp.]